MMRLPWYGKTVPHAVLDILRGCNCRCANCYNSAQPCAKSLDTLKSELAVIRAARNVTTISLSGGEPLMHPQILDIIAWLRSEGLKASLLTNGILFDDELAGKLRAAGLDFVTFHIQKGQKRPDCDDEHVDEVRREKGRIARAHGIYPAVVETIRADDAEGFAALGRFLRAAPEFEYALVTVARDFAAINPDVAESEPDRAPMLAALARDGYRSAVFVGGSVRRDRPRWYVLQSAQAVGADGRERAWNMVRPGLVERLFLWGYAILYRRSVHWVRSTSAKAKVRLLLNGLFGGRFSTLVFALRAIVAGWTVREKHIVVQYPPRSLGGGRIEVCDNCPDATVRGGKLRPLCLADTGAEEGCG